MQMNQVPGPSSMLYIAAIVLVQVDGGLHTLAGGVLVTSTQLPPTPIPCDPTPCLTTCSQSHVTLSNNSSFP
ncbi:hypothetical protein V8C44DRAFT_330671 [Trichoderma aethiopicum]